MKGNEREYQALSIKTKSAFRKQGISRETAQSKVRGDRWYGMGYRWGWGWIFGKNDSNLQVLYKIVEHTETFWVF